MDATTPTLSGPRALVRITQGLLAVVGAVAIVVGVATLIGGTIEFVGDLVREQWSFNLISGRTIPGGTNHGAVRLISGNWDSATVVLAGVHGPPAIFSAIAAVSGILTTVAVSALLALLCSRLLLGRLLFRRSLSRSIGVIGAVIAVGGAVNAGASSLASGTAADLLNGGTPHGFWPLGGALDLTWVFIGFVVTIVGLVFEYGERLQRDLEGLV